MTLNKDVEQLEKEVKEYSKAYVPWIMFLAVISLIGTIIGWLISGLNKTQDKIDTIGTRMSELSTKVEVVDTNVKNIKENISFLRAEKIKANALVKKNTK